MSKVLDATYVYGPGKFGEGAFGCVWKAKDRSGVEFALKQIDKEKLAEDKDVEHLEQELQHQYCLRHEGLVKLQRVYVTESSYFLVMEPVVGDTLLELITKGAISESKARMYFQQLLDAVSYMHRYGIAHRDLKLENLIITDNDKLKVCDFGLAVEFDGEGGAVKRTTNCGSILYMAPEMFAGGEYVANKCDVWAMGVILYSMCTGSFPFDDTKPDIQKKKISETEPEYPDHFSPELTRLIQDMLKKDPDERPDLERVVEYPWLMRYERNWGEEKLEWSDENLKVIDEPEVGVLTPLTVFQLAGAIRPLRFEHAIWNEFEDLRPVSFVLNLSEQAARRTIEKWVEQEYSDNASLEATPQSLELTVQTDESGDLGFTITMCELSGVQVIITMELHAGNPEYLQVLKGSLEQYVEGN